MAKEPLDYFNPNAAPEPEPEPDEEPPPWPAVPVEFDAKAAEVDEPAALPVIEMALRAAKIPFHRLAADAAAHRPVTLWVHAADLEQASLLAAGIFARRQRIKKLLPAQPREPDTGLTDAGHFGFDLTVD